MKLKIQDSRLISNIDPKKVGFITKYIQNFKCIFNFIKVFVNEVNFAINDDGISIIAMDSSHISLIKTFIPSDYFNVYNCINPTKKGIDLSIFCKIINNCSNNDELNIIFEEDFVTVSFINDNYNKKYKMRLICIDEEELDIPDDEDSQKISFDSKYFYNLIKDFVDIGDSLNFTIDEAFKVTCKGDMTETDLTINKNSYKIENKSTDEYNKSYTTSFINNFAKGYNLSKTIDIITNPDMPIQLNYSFLDTGYIKYFVAPKIDDDDDK